MTKAPRHPVTGRSLFGRSISNMFGWWRAGFLCVDCGYDTLHREYYMVHKRVWLAAGFKHDHTQGDGMCCIRCLERRLGRKLVKRDFPDYPINNPDEHNMSAYLYNKLTRK